MYGFSIIVDRISETCESYDFKGGANITYKNLFVSQRKFEKFADDKIFQEDASYIIGIDGVVLNLKDLKNSFAVSNYFDLIVNLYKRYEHDFPSQIKGEFSGFLFDKSSNELVVFMNKTKTKQLFYSAEQEFIVISPSLDNIVEYRTSRNKVNTLSERSSYHLMTFAGMVENETLVNEISQLGAGQYIKATPSEMVVEYYFDYNKVDYSISNSKQAIDKLNDTFEAALKLEYQKDMEYNYDHLATLSGGLDSRMNVFVADEFKFENTVFCFSQSDYLDERISRKISEDFGMDYQFIPLDGGPYFQDLEEMLSMNFGQQGYLGAAHLNYALKDVSQKTSGIIHTGMAGDALLGGFLAKGDYYSKQINPLFVDKCKAVETLESSFINEEVFKLHQRIFNFINFGFAVIENTETYGVSPFMDDDFIVTALSIEPSLKTKDRIYIDWINQKHPKVGEYVWEKTGFKADKKWKTPLSRYSKKLIKEYQKVRNRQDKLSMNPLEYWMANNESHKSFFKNNFENNISLLDGNPTLKEDVRRYFQDGTVMMKGIVLTILNVTKKYKLKV